MNTLNKIADELRKNKIDFDMDTRNQKNPMCRVFNSHHQVLFEIVEDLEPDSDFYGKLQLYLGWEGKYDSDLTILWQGTQYREFMRAMDVIKPYMEQDL